MVRTFRVGIVLSVVLAGTPALAGGPRTQGPRTSPHPLGRLGPVGGWNPDGRGLFHWWEPDCFAHPCTADDYRRKPLPRPHCTPRPVGGGHAHRHPWSRG